MLRPQTPGRVSLRSIGLNLHLLGGQLQLNVRSSGRCNSSDTDSEEAGPALNVFPECLSGSYTVKLPVQRYGVMIVEQPHGIADG